MTANTKSAFGIAAVAALCAAASPADARGIVCNGNYQLVAGSEISTPYCRDTNLARIARRSGFKVSEQQMLYNPSRKREICRYIGSNIDAQTACSEVDDNRGGRF